MLLCAARRSQWSGAKALAKLIKPKKENIRERGGDADKDGVKEKERAKSAPDIPLPAPPPLLPPEVPPSLSHWTANDKQDGSHTHNNHNHHISTPSLGPLSPALTPINRGNHTRTQNVSSKWSVGPTVLPLCSYRVFRTKLVTNGSSTEPVVVCVSMSLQYIEVPPKFLKFVCGTT